MNKTIEKKAKQMCRHLVVYTDAVDMLIAARALEGLSTRSIAVQLHMSESQVQYRISKAQRELGTSFRFDYRNGRSDLARRMHKVSEQMALAFVRDVVAPKFIPFAAPGVPRVCQAFVREVSK